MHETVQCCLFAVSEENNYTVPQHNTVVTDTHFFFSSKFIRTHIQTIPLLVGKVIENSKQRTGSCGSVKERNTPWSLDRAYRYFSVCVHVCMFSWWTFIGLCDYTEIKKFQFSLKPRTLTVANHAKCWLVVVKLSLLLFVGPFFTNAI